MRVRPFAMLAMTPSWFKKALLLRCQYRIDLEISAYGRGDSLRREISLRPKPGRHTPDDAAPVCRICFRNVSSGWKTVLAISLLCCCERMRNYRTRSLRRFPSLAK